MGQGELDSAKGSGTCRPRARGGSRLSPSACRIFSASISLPIQRKFAQVLERLVQRQLLHRDVGNSVGIHWCHRLAPENVLWLDLR